MLTGGRDPRRPVGFKVLLGGAMAIVVLSLGSPVHAQNGITSGTVGTIQFDRGSLPLLGEFPFNFDFFFACEEDGLTPSGLDQDCSFGEEVGGAGDGLLYLKGFDDESPLRIVGPGDQLAQGVEIQRMTFGSRTGSSGSPKLDDKYAGDRVAFAFEGGEFVARGIQESGSAPRSSCPSLMGSSSTGPFPVVEDIDSPPEVQLCPVLAGLLAESGLGRTPDLAYVVTFDQDSLGAPASIILWTCGGFVPICESSFIPADPALPRVGVLIDSGEPIDASDTDPYRGSRYW